MASDTSCYPGGAYPRLTSAILLGKVRRMSSVPLHRRRSLKRRMALALGLYQARKLPGFDIKDAIEVWLETTHHH
jgi:hypothetical protein